jgi:pyridoxine 5-phosphate synthase
MTKLSVNINKIALIRNARGGNNPDVVKAALDCEKFGADGITVHPRPDERHIRYADVYDLKMALTTELNVEGNPKEKKFMDLVMAVKPAQVTLVPDNPNQLTSNHGWNTLSEKSFLQDIITQLKEAGIRSSIFVDPQMSMIEGALETGTDRIELYTESFAHYFAANPIEAIAPYLAAAQKANELGLGLNAGHDLSLENLRFFAQHIPSLLEVSIGHALVCDALYYGLENTVGMYKRCL